MRLGLQNDFVEDDHFRSENLDFAERGLGLRNHFAGEAPFRKGALLVAKFRRALEFLAFGSCWLL